MKRIIIILSIVVILLIANASPVSACHWTPKPPQPPPVEPPIEPPVTPVELISLPGEGDYSYGMFTVSFYGWTTYYKILEGITDEGYNRDLGAAGETLGEDIELTYHGHYLFIAQGTIIDTHYLGVVDGWVTQHGFSIEIR